MTKLQTLTNGDIHAVLALLLRGLTTDGAHHKQWYMEQVLRRLTDDAFVKQAKEEFEWEDGIAP